jgi:parvulin-like peptidyl-prolyl isomerase
MARRFSIDPSTNKKGGDLGFVDRGSFSIVLPQLDRAINDMEPGDLAGPVKTRLGFHVVRLVSRRPTPFEKVRPEIETKLLDPPDPYRSFLEDAYSEVSVAPRYGRLDPNFRVVDRPNQSASE